MAPETSEALRLPACQGRRGSSGATAHDLLGRFTGPAARPTRVRVRPLP